VLPIDELLAGWTLAASRAGSIADATAELWGHLGFFDTDMALPSRLARYPRAQVEYKGPAARDQVRDVFARFDALLLVLGNGRYVTSGKVFDYMASALPVVSVHGPDVDAARVLEDYPLWFRPDSLEPESLAAALQRAADAARGADRATREACAAYAERFDRRRQLEPRLAALHQRVTAGVAR
jgi:hypothetical protein